MNNPERQQAAKFLDELEEIIRGRIRSLATGSYVASLIQAGSRRRAQKVGEEAVELAIATAAGDRTGQVEEAADLLFHLLVLLNGDGIRLAEVIAVLEKRHREHTGAGNRSPL